MIASRIKWPGLYICISMALWGAISAIMASVHNFAGLVVARIFLGAIEAVFFPGALYFLSLFYNRKQFALRTAILYSGSQLGNAFGGLFAIAILNLDKVHGLAGWRWVRIFSNKLLDAQLTSNSSSSSRESLPLVSLSFSHSFCLIRTRRSWVFPSWSATGSSGTMLRTWASQTTPPRRLLLCRD